MEQKDSNGRRQDACEEHPAVTALRTFHQSKETAHFLLSASFETLECTRDAKMIGEVFRKAAEKFVADFGYPYPETTQSRQLLEFAWISDLFLDVAKKTEMQHAEGLKKLVEYAHKIFASPECSKSFAAPESIFSCSECGRREAEAWATAEGKPYYVFMQIPENRSFELRLGVGATDPKQNNQAHSVLESIVEDFPDSPGVAWQKDNKAAVLVYLPTRYTECLDLGGPFLITTDSPSMTSILRERLKCLKTNYDENGKER